MAASAGHVLAQPVDCRNYVETHQLVSDCLPLAAVFFMGLPFKISAVRRFLTANLTCHERFLNQSVRRIFLVCSSRVWSDRQVHDRVVFLHQSTLGTLPVQVYK
jgi:hypothetical protein